MKSTVEARLAALEEATSAENRPQLVILRRLVGPGELDLEDNRAKVGDVDLARCSDESALEFTERIAAEARRQTPGGVGLAMAWHEALINCSS